MEEERLQTLHPNSQKTNKNISLAKYTQIKEWILSILSTKELTHAEMMDALLIKADIGFEGNVKWYGETVKLDLEARNIIERTSTKPQKYRLRR